MSHHEDVLTLLWELRGRYREKKLSISDGPRRLLPSTGATSSALALSSCSTSSSCGSASASKCVITGNVSYDYWMPSLPPKLLKWISSAAMLRETSGCFGASSFLSLLTPQLPDAAVEHLGCRNITKSRGWVAYYIISSFAQVAFGGLLAITRIAFLLITSLIAINRCDPLSSAY